MKQIQLIGPVDKRPIAYPLFKLCDTVGKTLVVTDDANFRRFADNYENEFTLGRSDFVVTNDIRQTILKDLGVRLNGYDFIIYITTNILIENNDCLVYCHGNSNLVCSEDVLDCITDLEHSDITISTQKVTKDKGNIFLSVDSKSFAYVWECEENKRFMPCKNVELVKLSNHLFASVLGIPSEEVPKIIVKEV